MQTEVYTCHICQTEAHLEDNFCQNCGSPVARPVKAVADLQSAYNRSSLESPLLSKRPQVVPYRESKLQAEQANDSLRQTTITLGILTASVFALALVAAFLAWLVDLAKVPIVSYVQTHMAVMNQPAKQSPALDVAAPTKPVPNTAANAGDVGNITNQETHRQQQGPSKVKIIEMTQPPAPTQSSPAVNKANSGKDLPAAKVYEQARAASKAAMTTNVPAASVAGKDGASNYAPAAKSLAANNSKSHLTIDPQQNPPNIPNESDTGYKPLMVNTDRTDADNHSGDGSFRIEMASEKTAAKAAPSAVASKSAPAVKPKPKYRNDDMATYNRLLADYFSHPEAGNGQGEPPSFEEWIKNGKTNF